MSKLNDFFVKNAMILCERHNIRVNIANEENEFDAYVALVDAGISQDEIVAQFESAMNLSFSDIRGKKFEPSLLYDDKITETIKNVKIFPFIDSDGSVKVAVSNPEQMDATENVMNTENYSYVFCFQFIINGELENVNIGKHEKSLDYAEKAVTKINGERKRIILASGEDSIDTLISESEMFTADYLTTHIVDNRSYLEEYCADDFPDILLVGDNIGGKGSLAEIILRLHSALPEMRIIYFCGNVEANDTVKKMMLGTIAAAGVYDIIAKNDISVRLLKNILDNPYTEEDAAEWLDYIKDSAVKKKNKISVYVPDVVETDDSVTIYPNLYTFTSPKGGVGKTFILEQVAIAIATCGIHNISGNKPRVGIIYLDFEGFGISKFFNTIHEKDNIFTAIEECKKVVNDLGNNVTTDINVEKQVNEKIHKLFRQSSKYSNIKVLGGNDLMYHNGDKSMMNNYILTYIFETVIDDFDVLLVDANTDMDTKIIYPLYSMSNNTYYVIDMDWNTFHNNKRYMMYLDSESLFIPTQSKFILNKAIKDDNLNVSINDIENGLKINFSAIFPYINPAVIFDLNSKSSNIIQADNKKLTEEKYYFLKLANDIYPISDFDKLEKSFENKIEFKISKRTKKENEKKAKEKEAAMNKNKGNKDGNKDKTNDKNGFSFNNMFNFGLKKGNSKDKDKSKNKEKESKKDE